jgi:hypothetical protein
MAKKTGVKFDENKPQHDLIPYESLDEIAKVLTFGMHKYGAANWASGIEYRRLISATYRHLGKLNSGEDLDDESNLPHAAHAAVNLIFLLWMAKYKPEMDDRWSKPKKK